jgi:hypothetical protein
MEYELKRHGITIPFDAIAKRLASEKDTTGPCVQQHLTKLRKEMLARGSWVPPLSGKPGSKQPQSDVRGYVMVKKRHGESEIREVLWTEDAFQYVDLVHINKAKMFEVNKSSGNGEGTPGSARRLLKPKKSAMDLTGDELDPADLPSDEEFDPSNKKSKYGKRVTRASSKFGGNLKRDDYDDAESDVDGESDSGVIIKRERKPVMMALYQSEEEEEVFTGIVILPIAQHLLAEYPNGINEAYRNTHGIQVGNTNKHGEQVFADDASDSGSHHPANTAQNYVEALAQGLGRSVMDANTPEDFGTAFRCGRPYSVMNANTGKNYLEAFVGGVDNKTGRGSQNGNNNDSDSGDSHSDCGDQRGNTATGDVNQHMVQPSSQVAHFANSSKNRNMFEPARDSMNNSHAGQSSMFNQTNNQQADQGNFMGTNAPTSTPVHNASGETIYAHNAVGYNPLQSAARFHDLLVGGPVHRAPNDDSYDGKTFAKIPAERSALSGGSSNRFGDGHGTQKSSEFVIGDTTSAVNDPFVPNEASFGSQMVGIHTGNANSPGVPAFAVNGNHSDQNYAVVPMDGLEVHDGNDENGTPEPSDDQPQIQSFMDSFNVSEQLPLSAGCLLIRSRISLTSLLTTSDTVVIE